MSVDSHSSGYSHIERSGRSTCIMLTHDSASVAAPERRSFTTPGVYGYPVEAAASVSMRALAEGLARHATIERARMVLFSEEWLEVFRRELERLRSTQPKT